MKTKLYLGEREHKLLEKEAASQSVSMSSCLRSLIRGKPPKKMPDFDWQRKTEELKRIGNRIDRIAYNLNRTGFLDGPELEAAASELDKAISEIEGVLFGHEPAEDSVFVS